VIGSTPQGQGSQRANAERRARRFVPAGFSFQIRQAFSSNSVLKPFGGRGFGIIFARIALWTRRSGAAADAGALALERSIRMVLTDPSAVIANEAFHGLRPRAGAFLFTRLGVSPCAALFDQAHVQRRSCRTRQADVPPFASRPRGIPPRCA